MEDMEGLFHQAEIRPIFLQEHLDRTHDDVIAIERQGMPCDLTVLEGVCVHRGIRVIPIPQDVLLAIHDRAGAVRARPCIELGRARSGHLRLDLIPRCVVWPLKVGRRIACLAGPIQFLGGAAEQCGGLRRFQEG